MRLHIDHNKDLRRLPELLPWSLVSRASGQPKLSISKAFHCGYAFEELRILVPNALGVAGMGTEVLKAAE